ncbi:hypothetical protein M5689_020150 [Euphorbia peplus]|nr:hypothetical protein M5689_020150 [Euphorbia peplus]
MTQFNNQQASDVYPPPPISYPPAPQHDLFVAPPPIGYPMKDGNHDQPQVSETKQRGFGKGCCAGLCCCCLLDACF